jgi:hypothetical protein
VLVIRSWPAREPAGHARVIDGVTRVVCDQFDYRPLALLGGDVLHLDWDTAVSHEGLTHFAEHAQAAPAEVLVAPCRVYPGSLHGATPRDLPRPVWNVRTYLAGGQAMRDTLPGEDCADLFGFGMVYLPADLLARFPGPVMDDISFAGWHHRQVGSARLCWDAQPVHLNYPPPVRL